MISRETVIGDLSRENERVQYDDKDSERLKVVGEALVTHLTDFFVSLDRYIISLEAKATEDSASEMALARHSLVEKWAFAQAAVSKAGWIIRLDGQEAFARLAASLKTGKAFNVSDL